MTSWYFDPASWIRIAMHDERVPTWSPTYVSRDKVIGMLREMVESGKARLAATEEAIRRLEAKALRDLAAGAGGKAQ